MILINSRNLGAQDKWTTYATLSWIYQAINKHGTVGGYYHKTTGKKLSVEIDSPGCPLIRLDINGNPVKDSRCPVPGPAEIIDRVNEFFVITPLMEL